MTIEDIQSVAGENSEVSKRAASSEEENRPHCLPAWREWVMTMGIFLLDAPISTMDNEF